MKIENYWGIDDDNQDELKYTDNIHIIMEEQCKYLAEYTNSKVFADFREINVNISFGAMKKAMLNVLKSISSVPAIEETNEEMHTTDLIDASGMYYEKRYGFEIYTEKYKFRLFELKMTPIYPIEVLVDEGICRNIGNKITRLVNPIEKDNHFKINDEDTFCKILQLILQDRKVRYIINELQRQEISVVQEEDFTNKVIICEGRTDEVILQAIAQRLKKKVIIVIADGKYNVSRAFKVMKEKNEKLDILIVVDSDGEEENTRILIENNLEEEKYQLVIINNCIEDWFMPKVADFSKIKMIQSIDAIINESNFDELCEKHRSFAEVIEFINK